MAEKAQANNFTGIIVLAVLIVVAAGALYMLVGNNGEMANESATDQTAVQSSNAPAFGNIDVEQAYTLINENQENTEFVLLDVRTDDEVNGGVFGHNNANFNVIDFYNPEFNDQLSQLDKSKTYVIYCRSGNRSGQTFARMQEMGFTNIYNVEGGINAWEAAGLPVEALE